MKPTLQIPSDIGEHCQNVAEALAASEAFLTRNIEQQKEWAEADGDADWMVMLDPKRLAQTAAQLAAAVQFIEWLAAHGDHQMRVEQQQ